MLNLSRKIGGRVVLFVEGVDPIIVQVLSCSPNSTKLGFSAPQGVTILREELIVQSPSGNGHERDTSEAGGTVR